MLKRGERQQGRKLPAERGGKQRKQEDEWIQKTQEKLPTIPRNQRLSGGSETGTTKKGKGSDEI